MACGSLLGGALAAPTGAGWLLRVAEGLVSGRRQLAIVGPAEAARDRLAEVAHTRVRPGVRVVVAERGHDDSVPLLAHRHAVDDRPAAWVCRDLACELPVTDPDALTRLLDEAPARG
jgi:uncharacterized protein